MTRKEFRQALETLEISQVGLARLIGVNDATCRRWARSGTNGAIAILLRLALKKKIALSDIAKARLED